MEKIVVLNSGGFDSITLVNFLCGIDTEEKEVYSLHFVYGARNTEQQMKCVDKVCKKYDIINQKITLPPFDWTSSNFYGEGNEYKTQYLEYRNLIFLSYALSFAESVGATKIYLATFGGGSYIDTSDKFFEALNVIGGLSGIEIVTPFSCFTDKSEILNLAIMTGVTPDDYWSCDTPKEFSGRRCGKCLDCKALDFIDKELSINHPFKALYQSGFDYSDDRFLKLMSVAPKDMEVRALINNDCQLKCKHCFYGFDEMVGEKVDRSFYYERLKELVHDFGFTNIHFSGKEPLLGDDLLYYAHRIKDDNLPCTFNVVTNGILIPQKIKELKECGIEKVFLSVDDVLGTNEVRFIKGVTDKAITACNKVGVPVEVFIDLHTKNYKRIYEIVKYLIETYKVKNFYIRTIRSIGNAKHQTDRLTGEMLASVFFSLDTLSTHYEDCIFRYSISSEYLPEVERDIILLEKMNMLDSFYSNWYRSNFFIFIERYCDRYYDITITPDGYVLGCASEVSRPDYDKISAGNILTDPISTILKKGIKLRVECASKFCEDNCSCMMNKI